MRKRLISVLCVLTLCLTLLPVTALAAEGPTTLVVGGTSVIDSTNSTTPTPTYWRNDGQGGITAEDAGENDYNVKYDGSGTLTLKGAYITGTHTFDVNSRNESYACGIFADGDLTIQLEGENTIAISSEGTGAAGIFSLASGLTIQGGGSLSVAAAGTGYCHGICAYSDNGNKGPVSITITDGAQVTAAAAGPSQCYGICAEIRDPYYPYYNRQPASVAITDGARVEARAHSTGTGYQNSYGIFVSGASDIMALTIEDAQVTAIAGGNGLNLGLNVRSDHSSTGSLSITGSTVDVQVRSTGAWAVGIKKSEGAVTSITGSAVTIRAEGATGATGMELVDTSSGEATPLSITGSTVTVWGSTGTGEGVGVVLHHGDTEGPKNAVSIQNSTVTVGGASESGAGWGIFSGSGGAQPLDLTVSGSLLRVTGEGTAEGSGSICSGERTGTRTDSIVFENGAGTVSGQAALPEDLTVERGETLTVPERAELTVPAGKTLTVAEGGTLINEGTITVAEGGTVDNYGTVEAANGTIDNDGTWTNRVTGITLNPASTSLTVGSTAPLTATVTRGTVTGTTVGTDEPLTWASSNSGAATVRANSTDSATVTAVGAGTAVITVRTADGGYTDTCTVTVEPAPVSSGDDSEPTYSVTLPDKVTGGSVTATKRYAEKGETFRFTVTPDEGWELDTLTATDSRGNEIDLTDEGNGKYIFKMPAGRVEIQAAFRKIVVEPEPLPFTDVAENAWYAQAVRYVYEHGLMAGTSATTFAPEVTTSRAMIATILWRMAGSPVVNYAMNYTDVAQGQWCSEAIRWATSEGIVTGYGNGLFGTNDPITRQQFAAMLWRYAQAQGYDVSIGEDTNILSYTDVANLSEYAIPAMQWAVGAGIINGTGDGSTLTPQGQATRAQAAVMLMRFCERYTDSAE